MLKVKLYQGVLSRDHCNRLIGESSAQMTRAMFWTKGERVFDPKVRDAYNCKLNDPEIAELSRKLAQEFSGEAIIPERVEHAEIVCYPPGNGIERHLDGPHRSHSLVFFLNSGYGGGELVFDDKFSAAGAPAGSMVIWENDAESYHQSNPITAGFKWILVIWVRRADALVDEKEIHAKIKAESAR